MKNKTVTICLEVLFNKLADNNSNTDHISTTYGHLEKEVDGDNEWYDFINDALPYEGRACMDGEICEIIEETDQYVLLQEVNEQIPFKLSKKEFAIAANFS